MIEAVDTSVLVNGAAPWQEGFEVARAVLDRRPSIPAHALVEAYSVLTRLPEPLRLDPVAVAAYLEARCPAEPLVLPPETARGLPARLAAVGISAGATFDAVIALTAVEEGATLMSFDRRAGVVYDRLGVEYRLLSVEP